MGNTFLLMLISLAKKGETSNILMNNRANFNE